MTDIDRRQKQFYQRAQHQLREIQFSCREVVSLNQNINFLGTEMDNQDINCRKFQFLKGEIKQKLKEFASNIDQIYKILDRKLLILAKEINMQLSNQNSPNLSKSDHNSSRNKTHVVEKESQKTNERSHQSYDIQRVQRAFSDTLNPRVAQLEAKIAQYDHRETTLNSKVMELKSKNEKLLEEFNRLSTASNKKINELSVQLHNISSRDRDSFNSLESSEVVNLRQVVTNKPVLLLDPTEVLCLTPNKNKKQKDLYHPEQEFQGYGRGDNMVREEEKARLTFGCIPVTNAKQQNSGLLTFPKVSEENYENLDKEDRHRRFDLLLNKLKYFEQEDKNTTPKKVQQFKSVLSRDVVRRYQI